MRLLIISFGFICHTLAAQTAESDLQKVLDPLVNAAQLYFENEYLYFEGDETIPAEMLTGLFHRNGTQEYARMDKIEILKSADLFVAVDHEDRVVTAQPDAPVQSLNELVDPEKIKALLDTRESKVQYVGAKGTWKGIQIIDPEKPDEKLILYYEPATWTIREASITTPDPFANAWEKTPKKIVIVVRYLDFTTEPKPFPYKVEHYVRKSGNRYVATGKCRGYQRM